MFLYLCEHKKKFNIKASWSFFASYHGKSPCDGIAGTAKRLAFQESMRCPLDNQIMNVIDLNAFFLSLAWEIIPILILKSEIESVRNRPTALARTLPGTRSFHYFLPLTDSFIRCKIASTDELFNLTFDLNEDFKYSTEDYWSPNMYVGFILNRDWFIGQITNLNEEEDIANIMVMQFKKKPKIFQ